MPHEHVVGICAGLVLVASVVLMIGSLDRVSRSLRGPLAAPRVLLNAAQLP